MTQCLQKTHRQERVHLPRPKVCYPPHQKNLFVLVQSFLLLVPEARRLPGHLNLRLAVAETNRVRWVLEGRPDPNQNPEDQSVWPTHVSGP